MIYAMFREFLKKYLRHYWVGTQIICTPHLIYINKMKRFQIIFWYSFANCEREGNFATEKKNNKIV